VAAVDCRLRRVPNALLLAAFLPAGVVLVWSGTGVLGVGATTSFMGALIGGLVLLPGYLWFRLGAGDIKLAAVIGFLVGLRGLPWLFLLAALILGLMSLAVVLGAGRGKASDVRLPAAVALGGGFALILLLTSWGK